MPSDGRRGALSGDPAGLVLDPSLAIVDAHHHLLDLQTIRYLEAELLADVSSGHDVVATVYCETRSFARVDGPEALRPLGEVEFANGVGAMHATGRYGRSRLCAGIVGYADLRSGADVAGLLDRCAAAAPDRFRGVRQVTLDYPDERPFRYVLTHRPPSGILDDPGFERGLSELEARGLVFDAAIYDPSLPRIAALADEFPDLVIVLDHMGTAVGVDMSPSERAEVFARWRRNLRMLAERPNVRCKVGGLGMPVWGFGFEAPDAGADHETLADAWRPYVETAIEAFGPGRCMMESNFPVDRRSCGYRTLWNALKHLTRHHSADERADMFARTAMDTYRLTLPPAGAS